MRISDWSSDVCSSDLILGRHRNVGALVAAETLHHLRVMVAIDAGMDLERHPVIKAHPRHFGEHLRAEQLGLSRREIARPHLGVEPFGIGAIEIGGGGAGAAVIRSEENTSELQSLMRNSYAVF